MNTIREVGRKAEETPGTAFFVAACGGMFFMMFLGEHCKTLLVVPTSLQLALYEAEASVGIRGWSWMVMDGDGW